ncbi:M23 family metallopeptidase [Magnetospirillum gryphiswaldense]|uniref:Peptidase M23B n=1 Tax=Magnetospirillum gryphiswaldense (strain DSM 6361 / JCM 21280 / NBRC 15271 / MSR-1) TaxID=431944 RepID=V6F238_MAGGM|nr:M23 family metallopeptidase [Magnetospirillum gryphiswaldense]AVM74719.1 Murein DD-endopeptidase MepM [Magnetospirillum gryphiswaldense MSR-1]AVM78622.1 Murein DD-endopeptidase MepM [Magnetospirillum gryphiswaldense]CDK99452.1 putative Peptidase M23B [Magnetospirillum gryphiswaldense MSR-1 v2]
MHNIVHRLLPEWQVFVRDADGQAKHFIVSRRLQLLGLVGVAALAFWAGTSTTLLSHRPTELAEKERRLDEMLATNRVAQQRLVAAEKLVGDIAREVDSVHANLQTLAESSDVLARERSVRVTPRPSLAPTEDQVAEADESRQTRQKVRDLEASLARLQLAYAKAAQQVAESAGARISETETRLSRLGLDPMRLFADSKRSPGQGGPFIPFRGAVDGDGTAGTMITKVQHWIGVKATLQRLPLAEPIHSGYDFNSGFGTRNDPLNNRTGIHEGIDLGAPIGTPVYATGDGTVIDAGEKSRYGQTVDIDHGNGLETRYAHLSRIKVQPGQKVTRATIIGLVGNTGRSTGPHLHYEVRLNDVPRDPIKFISAGRDAAKTR